ncbi:MAG: hypothetical protein WBC13_04910 [Dokdonella sp.]|jgi:hypothetical protein|uniref:hypothetical protein n=1 Tax=Dokdonella sp. TaxID=2291710 RepID=UPI002BB61866|nr:hypothetical protein [Dokdonella sp.]HNV09254.1 hypothetical protein [Dokdonella sp.]
MFKKFVLFPIAALAFALVLSACDKKEESAVAPAEQAPEVVTLPAPGSDAKAWQKYLAAVVMQNMQGVKTNRPYMYFVPEGAGAEIDRSNQLENVKTTVARGVLPGNMLAFGGPDSSLTANMVVDSFAEAGAGTFKDVTVLFVGAAVDRDRVEQALTTSGATFRFAEMK